MLIPQETSTNDVTKISNSYLQRFSAVTGVVGHGYRFPRFRFGSRGPGFFFVPDGEKTAFSSRIQRLFRFFVQDVEDMFAMNSSLEFHMAPDLLFFCPIRFVLELGPDFPKITYPFSFHHAKQTEIIIFI